MAKNLLFALAICVLTVHSSCAPIPTANPTVPVVSIVTAAASLAGAIGIVGATYGIPGTMIHGHATNQRQRRAKMDFISPNTGTIWKCGQDAQIHVVTFGFGSRWGLKQNRIVMYDSDGNKVSTLLSGQTADFIKVERTMKIGRPRHGRGLYKFRVPTNFKSGKYLLEYETNNQFNWDRSRFRFVSPVFEVQCNGTDAHDKVDGVNDTTAAAPKVSEKNNSV
ncbi:hypothetical protein BKA69DRAFT_1125603 [Paraphysoderma sedebokerense]|nr:hypothetical protein BKA69DRAFT_1125603 [Paraphysoderma sedebokerense]